MHEKLSKKEQDVIDAFLKKMKLPRAKSGRLFVVGMIGLVGSGKSSVADILAQELGAVIVSGDMLRIALRKKKVGFVHLQAIARRITARVLEQGGSVVVDSDFVDAGKRNEIKKVAKDGGAQMRFVRVVCDHDVIIGRIMAERFGTKATDLFAGAETTWKGQKKPAVVKLREMWRRTPHHYTWSMDKGGHWVQKTIQDVFATVDTTESLKTKKKIKEIAGRIVRTR